LAGKNGTGKSTLLNLITGGLTPDSGTIDKGETTVFGYFHQQGIAFKEDERVIDIVKNVAEFITMADGKMISASALLTLFLFPPAKQYGFMSKLSGGEKKRLQLMHILMKNPNFLILDEPTNDLDIDTLNVLEEFLINYGGVLMMVSHDRYLLDKLTDQLFIIEDAGNVRIYNGNYSSYRLDLEDEKQQNKKSAVVDTPAPAAAIKKNKLSFKEQKELDTLEKEIEQVENQIKDTTDQLNVTGIDNKKVIELSEKIAELNSKLDEKSMRWIELTELLEA
jgi:ATP-binding cassette subfamily F protein uup